MHSKPGRNDACPCGSGKKYKKCCLQQALARPTASEPPVDMNELFTLHKARRYAELETQAGALIERHRDSGPLWKMLGLALWMQGKDALQALEASARLMPEDPEAHTNLGNWLRAIGRLEDAAAAHRRAIASDADYADAHNNLGSVLHDLGRLDEAEASYQRALAIKPDFALAHDNLGIALFGLGQLDEALASHRRALALQPDRAETYRHVGNALRDLGRLEEAAAGYRRALELNPNDLEAHHCLGSVLLALGRAAEGVPSFRRALELKPNSAEVHNNLGNALLRLGQPQEAVGSYLKAIAIKPGFAKAHGNLGSAYRDLWQLDEAETAMRRALEIEPKQAEFHTNLGMVQRLRGRPLDAEASCRRALELNPSLPAAHVLLAELQADRGLFAEAEISFKRAIAIEPNAAQAWAGLAGLRQMTDDDDWIAEAQRVAGSGIQPREEAHLRYAIGKYFDDIGHFEQAFHSYRRANELTKTFTPAHDRHALTQSLDAMLLLYDEDWIKRVRALASTSDRPVFIVGMPRSGTSLAEQILASHPDVFGAGELLFWKITAPTIARSMEQGTFRETLVREAAVDYLEVLLESSANALRVVDKMPGNFAFLGLIHGAFPRARIIHMKRNPIDTCLSIYFQNFHTAHSYANDLEDIAHCYTEYLRVMDRWRAILPADAILEVPYEELIDDAESWSRKMVEFIGLAWNSACTDFHLTNRTVSTFSKWQIRQKIRNSSVDRWRNYAQFLGALEGLSGLPPTLRARSSRQPEIGSPTSSP